MRTVHVAAMLIALMAAIRAHAQTSVTNTPEGFQSQFHAVFEAFQHHNEAGMQERLQTFAIPSQWFTDSFVPGQAAEFTRQYAEAFADFKRRTASNFAGIDTLKKRVQVDAATPVNIRTRRWTPAESTGTPHLSALRTPLPSVQKFEIDYMVEAPRQGARLTSWIESLFTSTEPFASSGRAANPSGRQPQPEIHQSVSSNDENHACRLAPET
jgi:hypothetical protein